jgi:hypothetical protein
MTLHPRRDWTSTPAADAHPFEPTAVRGTAVHWNGPPVPESALTDPRSYLEGVRRFHVGTNGWSDIAYNFAVDQRGDIWTLRGMRHMSGANGDSTVNAQWVAVLAIIGVGQKPSPSMLEGIKTVAGMVRDEYPRGDRVTTHQAIRPTSTACPGPDLIPWVTATNFTEEDDMAAADDVIEALVEALKDKDSPLSVQLRGNVRIAVQHELMDEREGKNTERP